MKDPGLEQQLLLATIDDRDEAPDAFEDDNKERSTRLRSNAIITETIPEESGNASSPENEEAERPASLACPASDPATRKKVHHNKVTGSHRRHRKFGPIHQLSLYRQVTI